RISLETSTSRVRPRRPLAAQRRSFLKKDACASYWQMAPWPIIRVCCNFRSRYGSCNHKAPPKSQLLRQRPHSAHPPDSKRSLKLRFLIAPPPVPPNETPPDFPLQAAPSHDKRCRPLARTSQSTRTAIHRFR